MCIGATALSTIATGASAFGKIFEGNAVRQANNAKAQAEELAAAQTRQVAQEEAKRIRLSGEKAKGAARAQLAASGVDVNSGSAINIEEEIGLNTEQTAVNRILSRGREADALSFSAQNRRTSGQNAMTSSVLGAAAEIGLTGWKNVKRGY